MGTLDTYWRHFERAFRDNYNLGTPADPADIVGLRVISDGGVTLSMTLLFAPTQTTADEHLLGLVAVAPGREMHPVARALDPSRMHEITVIPIQAHETEPRHGVTTPALAYVPEKSRWWTGQQEGQDGRFKRPLPLPSPLPPEQPGHSLPNPGDYPTAVGGPVPANWDDL